MKKNKQKTLAIDYSNSIKKSNELSMAELNFGLHLNQMQLLAFAVFCTQKDGKTAFHKYEFQKKFNIQQYRTDHAYKDSKEILNLKVSVKDEETDYFTFTNIFSDMVYDKGKFIFKWNPKVTPHILELKDRYVLTDLRIASKFRSSYSWTLYEYLKAHYGYWNKELSRDELMNLFGVKETDSYRILSNFKKRVLDTAIDEVNKYTELEVWYTQKKDGRKVIGFVLHWSTGERKAAATKKQLKYLQNTIDEVNEKMLDYLSIKNTKNLDNMRQSILKIQEIDKEDKNNLTTEKASSLIEEAMEHYKRLEYLLENDKEVRDTSVYFDWTKGEN